VPVAGDLCEAHARLAAELGRETVINGAHAKKRSARQRTPVATESEPLELTSHGPNRPSAVRPALALTAAEEGRDNPSRPTRGSDKHEPAVAGNLQLS